MNKLDGRYTVLAIVYDGPVIYSDFGDYDKAYSFKLDMERIYPGTTFKVAWHRYPMCADDFYYIIGD